MGHAPFYQCAYLLKPFPRCGGPALGKLAPRLATPLVASTPRSTDFTSPRLGQGLTDESPGVARVAATEDGHDLWAFELCVGHP